MTNSIIFSELELRSIPKVYQGGMVVEFYAGEPVGRNAGFNAPFKFIYKGPHASEFPSRFLPGDKVRIRAIAESYKGKVYGKMRRPIKYPDGTFRWTKRVRFNIIKIKKGFGWEV